MGGGRGSGWRARLRLPWVRRGEAAEVVLVEDLLPGARAVPEAHPAGRVLGLEEVGEVGAQRGHARAPADIDHLPLRGFDMEITERSDGSNDIAWLQALDQVFGAAIQASRRRHPGQVA